MQIDPTLKPTVQPAVQPTAQNMSQFFESWQNTMQPAQRQISQDYNNSVAGLAQLHNMNPDMIKSLINSGDLLRASVGFNNANELTAMSPTEYAQIASRNINPLDALKGINTTLGQITGLDEYKKNQAAANAAQFQNNANMLHAGGSAAAQSQNHLGEQQFKSGSDVNSALNSASMHGVSNALQNKQIEEMAAGRKATTALGWANHNQRERQIKYLKDFNAGTFGAQVPGTTPDTAAVKELDIQLKQQGVISKDGTKLKFEDAPDKYTAVSTYLRRMAASGMPYGTDSIVKLDPAHASLFGSDRLVLTNRGWHPLTTYNPGEVVTLSNGTQVAAKGGEPKIENRVVVPYINKSSKTQTGLGGYSGMLAYSEE